MDEFDMALRRCGRRWGCPKCSSRRNFVARWELIYDRDPPRKIAWRYRCDECQYVGPVHEWCGA